MPAKAMLRLDPAAKEALAALQAPGEKDLYRHLVEVFLKTSDEFLKSLKTGDVASLHQTAHAWRSSSSGIGAQILAELCSQLEVTRDPSRLRGLIAEIEQEYSAVKAELVR